MKAVYFNTHATLSEYHARLCMRSLAKQSKRYKWDYFFVYNSHPDELSNELLYSIFKENKLHNRFKYFEIVPYDPECKKTNLQDFRNLIDHCKNNFSVRGDDYVLYLKSEYVLSRNFINSLKKFDDSDPFIFSAMIENAKEFVGEKEIFDRAKRSIFTLVDDVTYYAGSDYKDEHPEDGGIPEENTISAFELKTHWNDDPKWFGEGRGELRGFRRMKTGPDGITEPFHPQIRFISHACRGDVNVHYMPAQVFVETSLRNSKHHTWGYWQGWNQHIANGTKMLNTPEAFAIHVFHDIISKNRLEPRNDPNKIIEGQRY